MAQPPPGQPPSGLPGQPTPPGGFPPPAGPYPPAGPPAGGYPPPQPGSYPPPGAHPPPGAPPPPGQYQPGGYPPPAGPYPVGAPGYPGPGGPGYPGAVAPKKRRGFAVVLVLLALVALVCCGAVGYGGWWQPRQKLAQNERVLEQMGVPKGFQDSPVRNPAGTTDVFTEYFLLCKNAVCPVQPAGAIHEWLRYNEAPADRKVVESCLHWAAQPNPQPCRFQWAGNGWRVEVTAVWQVAQGQADEDREWKVRATVYAD